MASGAAVRLLERPSVQVRCTAVEALGMIGKPAAGVTAGLVRGLQDQEAQVRFMAGLSLARIGQAAAGAVPQLRLALDDDNRYVTRPCA